MPVSVSVPANRSVYLRSLAARHPYLTPVDIAKLTGESPDLVRAALGRPIVGRPKSRLAIEARGPLSAAQVASKTGMSLADAQLLVR